MYAFDRDDEDRVLGAELQELLLPGREWCIEQVADTHRYLQRYRASVSYDASPGKHTGRIYGYGTGDTILEAMHEALDTARPLGKPTEEALPIIFSTRVLQG